MSLVTFKRLLITTTSFLTLACAQAPPVESERTDALPKPGPTQSLTPQEQQSPRAESKVAVRFSELVASDQEKTIVEEFERDELVREASALFPHKVSYKNLSLHSDVAFDEQKGLAVLVGVHGKLEASPIFDPAQEHHAFVCQRRWTEEYFLKGAGRLGGLCYFPVANHVFLTKADIENNALLSPRRRPIAPPRTLDYYIAHEFTHTLIGHEIGPTGFNGLPHWLSEGYPDYVGLGPDFTLEQARTAYENRDPRVNGTLAEDYMRFDIYTAYYLEEKKADIRELLRSCPEEGEALAESSE